MTEATMQQLLAEAGLRVALTHHQAGRLGEAEAAYRRVLELCPDTFPAWHNLGVIALEAGRAEESERLLRRAAELAPEDAGVYGNLGLALIRLGRGPEALEALRKAERLGAGDAAHHYNLGTLLRELGYLDEAIEALRRAARLRPGHALTHNNLGVALLEKGDAEESLAELDRALALDPTLAEAHHNRGLTLVRRDEVERAIPAFERAEALAPGLAAFDLALAHSLICDWTRRADDLEAIRAALRGGDATGIPPFTLLTLPVGPADQLSCARRWAGQWPGPTVFPHRAEGSGGRIKIGYLSGDFREHAVAILLAELIECHDRSRFEIHAYSAGPDDQSAMRRRLVAAFDHFLDIRDMAHAEVAERVNRDGIDILVDLSGYTGLARSRVVALRPAPVQVNYLGYPGTMGAPFIDYIVADATVAPLADQAFFSERIVQMPFCYQPNDTKRRIDGTAPTRAEAGLPERGFVFCCFNSSPKIAPETFAVWMRLLKEVDGSVLWLLDGGDAVRRNLRREAESRGVAPERLVFAPKLRPPARHLARHALADLFLDTLPYNAHTTGSDALWTGLPLVTCQGETFAGRVGASLLRAVHLEELVTHSLEEYEALALELASDRPRLSEIRRKLVEERESLPLFDIRRYTRALEAAYLRMMEIHRAGEAPQSFAVGP